MTPIKYCYDLLVASRDPLYFCVKKAPKEARDSIIGVRAFYLTLEKLILASSDPIIVQQQLFWWREEISKTQPQHPIAILLNAQNIPKEKLIAIIESFIGLIANSHFETFEEVVIFTMQTAGAREKMIVDIVTPGNNISVEIIYELTLALELTHYIQHLRPYIRRGLLLFSEEELKKFHLTYDDFNACKTTPNIQHLLAFQAQKVERIYEKTHALKSISGLNILLTQINIAHRLLKVIKGQQFELLENYIQLTPLKMWWVAYR